MALVAVCGFRRSLGTGKSLSFVRAPVKFTFVLFGLVLFLALFVGTIAVFGPFVWLYLAPSVLLAGVLIEVIRDKNYNDVQASKKHPPKEVAIASLLLGIVGGIAACIDYLHAGDHLRAIRIWTVFVCIMYLVGKLGGRSLDPK